MDGATAVIQADADFFAGKIIKASLQRDIYNKVMSYDPVDNKNVNILIVDDEKYIFVAISRWLEPEGYNCVVAHNYNEAVACLEQDEFQLLISDINMPGKSGIELLRVTRERFPRTAILMATAPWVRGIPRSMPWNLAPMVIL
jgi:PleD family two-component response regulator